MSETQQRLADQFQALLQQENPEMDFSPGSVLNELTIKPNASILAEQEASLDELRENMSLLQLLSQDDLDSTYLDRLLSNYNVIRREGSKAAGQLNIYTQSTQNVSINSSQTFTCAGIQLRPLKSYIGVHGTITGNDTAQLQYVQVRQYNDDTWVFTIEAQTVDDMETVLSPGQSCSMSPELPQVSSVTVASTFTGGSLEEDSNTLLDRAQTQINAMVLTGRDNIKAMLERNGSVEVLNTAVFGMGDALMLRDNYHGVSGGGAVDAYVKTEPVPSMVNAALTGEKDSDDVWTIEIPAATYPGVYGITQIQYDNQLITEFTEVLSFTTDDTAPWMGEMLHARFSKYQALSAQFSTLQPLTSDSEAQFTVSLLYMPGLSALQELVENPNVRSYGFDMLIKGAVPVVIAPSIDISYPKGMTVPDEEDFQNAVADTINSKPIGEEYLQSSEIVYACKQLFSAGEVAMPIHMFARTWLPEGGTIYTTSQTYVKVADLEGLSYQNAFFTCFPSSVDVTLTEVDA